MGTDIEPADTRTSASADELPVVARMVVEIRSDGRRTVARGALEDRLNEQTVALEIGSGSPLQLAKAIAQALWSLPGMALRSARARRRPDAEAISGRAEKRTRR